MSLFTPYDNHLSPPPEDVYYEPCDTCKGQGQTSRPAIDPRSRHDLVWEECESCDGKGEIKIEP